MVNLQPDIEGAFGQLKEPGLSGCRLCGWNESFFTKENAGKIKTML
ncbi:MAG: hypothetical protein LBH26_04815 [Treponema sp.]|jgi:hypothetical protein|nr:hypothetical protein [Treponema sp.]